MRNRYAIRKPALIIIALGLQLTETGHASVVVVDSRSGPWQYVDGGLNTTLQYGFNDHSAPTTIVGLGFGQSVTVTYQSGVVSPLDIPLPAFDANGSITYPNPGLPPLPGDPRTTFPGYYSADPNSTYWSGLIGVFTDSAGKIVGLPVGVGNGPISFAVPTGATQFQLGVNDNLFGDNSGAWTLNVQVVPEPEEYVAAFGVSLLGTGVWLRRKKAQGVGVK